MVIANRGPSRTLRGLAEYRRQALSVEGQLSVELLTVAPAGTNASNGATHGLTDSEVARSLTA